MLTCPSRPVSDIACSAQRQLPLPAQRQLLLQVQLQLPAQRQLFLLLPLPLPLPLILTLLLPLLLPLLLTWIPVRRRRVGRD